jgi:hypothetical protein
MLEKDIKKKTLSKLRQAWPNAIIWKLADAWTSGLPDILFIYLGVVVFIELKRPDAPKKELDGRPLQKYILKTLNDNMVPATVAHSADEACEFIRRRLYEKGIF